MKPGGRKGIDAGLSLFPALAMPLLTSPALQGQKPSVKS
jgi:hypothetical protein